MEVVHNPKNCTGGGYTFSYGPVSGIAFKHIDE